MNETVRICPRCGAAVPAEAPQGLCPKCVLGGAVETAAPASQGGAGAEPPSLERIAAAFPQLEVVELIGAGGMGAVFKARQPKLERWVALKVLRESLAKDPAFAERFSREARLLARLNHPNIVAVHDFGQADGFFYLIMEYVDGVNLRDAMAAGRFTPSQALSLVPRICEALQFAHDEGILHRDIKPENILLDVKGRVKIADFGIAKLLGPGKDATLTASGAAVGTPHYMAPEQLDHPQEVDQRADIYSLGVVFYEMLTGELPIGRFAPPSEKSPVDPRVDPIVLRALERDRDKRFKSISEVKTRVEDLGPLSDTAPKVGPAAPPPTAPPPTLAPKWSRKAIVAAILSCASLVLGLGLVGLVVLTVAALSKGGGAMGLAEVGLLLVGGLLAAGMALAGLIVGLMARREIRDSHGSLRGGGLALLAIWLVPCMALGAVLLAMAGFGLSFFMVRMVAHESRAAGPGLLLRQTYQRRLGSRLTESRWVVSAAPGRQVDFSIHILSNGVPVVVKPLTASFTTTEPGGRTEGTFTAKVWPVQPAPDDEPQWQAHLDAGPHGSFPLDLVWPNSPPIRWESVRDIPKFEVAMNGGTDIGLFEGTQEPNAVYGHKARWEARLRIAVKPPPPLVEFAPATPITTETNQLERP